MYSPLAEKLSKIPLRLSSVAYFVTASTLLMLTGNLATADENAQPVAQRDVQQDNQAEGSDKPADTTKPADTAPTADPTVDPHEGHDHEGHSHGAADPAAANATQDRKQNAEAMLKAFKENAPKDVYEAGMQALAEFETVAKELKLAVAEMRKQHTLYANGYETEKKPYLDARDRSRTLMRKTYRKALDVLDYMPYPSVATFAVAMVEQRFKHDVYDAETYEGAAKLLDAGVRWDYVVLSAARAGLANGDFRLAEKIYENVDFEQLDDKDKAMVAMQEVIKQQYETEQELLKNDPTDLPKVRILTTRGEIVADLFINEAPSTVSHFINLVESGFYDGLDFFQVIDGLLALTGDPLGDGSSRPDRYIADEHGRKVVRMPLAGSLVMAKLPAANRQFVPNSAGTQFAMLYMPFPTIIEQQTVFGRVTEGLDILGALRHVDPHKEKKKGAIVAPPDRIISCEIINRPEKLPEVIYADPPPGVN